MSLTAEDPPPSRPFVEPIKPIRTFEAAIEQLVEGIEAHRLRRGDRLPSEGELASQLGISKPTLRQALRILERAGVVESRRGKAGGIFLCSDVVPTAAISGEIAIEADAVLDILRARRVLETAVTEFAMSVADATDYDELDRVNGLLRRSVGNRQMVLRVDSMFHRAIARASHNRALSKLMRQLTRELAPVRDAYLGGVDLDWQALDIHTRQVMAMRQRSLEELNAVLDEHFRMAEEAFALGIHSTWEDLFGLAARAFPLSRSQNATHKTAR